MNRSFALYKPPFTPADEQVIYLEWEHNEGINVFIRNNYEWMKNLFLSYGLHFCYLPMLGKEVIRYNAPYLTDKECDKIVASLPSLQESVMKGDEFHGPVLAFAAKDMKNSYPDVFILHYIIIETKWYRPTKSIFKKLAEEIHSTRDRIQRYESPKKYSDDGFCFRDAEETKEEGKCNEPPMAHESSVSDKSSDNIRFSLREKTDEEANVDSATNENRPSVRRRFPDIQFSIEPRRKEADEVFDEQAKVLVKEIKERINALRDCGVNTMFLHNIIDEGEHVSSLYITKDYRIILPDYDNMEITIPDLPKAVFFLFLRHPEGIRFKDLADYREELINIYRALNPIGGTQRQQHSIRELTNPLSNSINEKCARIREAFISKFDDRLAQNYYITGKRGEPKRITLDEKKVVWEQ